MTPFDGHDEDALRQNSQDIRRIVIWVVGVLCAIVAFGMTYLIGSFGGRVYRLEQFRVDVTAKEAGFEQDHILFRDSLTRIESKIDKAISHGLLD